MCGICISVINLESNYERPLSHFKNDTYKTLIQCLKRRGPNSFNRISEDFNGKFNLLFCSSVLHLRGSDLIVQPIVDDRRNMFLWNGEIFDGPLIEYDSDSNSEISDTALVAEKMFKAKTTEEILEIISSIKGPYAFIFYQAKGLLWFGRDLFGRRSLLWNSKDSVFQLCSVGIITNDAKWEEVPTGGIFCLDLSLSLANKTFVLHYYAWSSSASGSSLNTKIEHPVLNSTVEVRLSSDLTAHMPLSESLNKSIPSDSSLSDFLYLLTDFQNKKLSVKELFQEMLDLPILKEKLNNFETVLSQAVKRRVQKQLSCCKECYIRLCENNSIPFCDHSQVGVLFSGGLDSIVIACLADKYVDSQCYIDLMNVAFASKKNMEAKANHMHFDTPDRITGKTGYEALKNLSPSRKWNFVEVNVLDTALNHKREKYISELLYPSCTVLDDSIGCALWFASQGDGFTIVDGERISYKSPARVLLVGMGADEQLAGYSRHRAKFKNAGWNGLIEEIALELDRIGSRNLGRDDRIIADSSVESRYPFLDESVVSFLNSLPIWLKANLNFDRGVGEKLLLRLLAFKLGLTEAAALPKRAIQFGSRIAKLENHKEKGSDVCTRLLQLSC